MADEADMAQARIDKQHCRVCRRVLTVLRCLKAKGFAACFDAITERSNQPLAPLRRRRIDTRRTTGAVG